MERVLSFKAEDELVTRIEEEAKSKFCSVSAILRQIVHAHFGLPPGGSKDIPEEMKASPGARTARLTAKSEPVKANSSR